MQLSREVFKGTGIEIPQQNFSEKPKNVYLFLSWWQVQGIFRKMSAERWTDTGCAFHLRSVDAALSGENHSEHKVITDRTITAVMKWCTTGPRHKKAVSFRRIIKGIFCFRADSKVVYIEKQLRIPKHIISVYFISSFPLGNATNRYK